MSELEDLKKKAELNYSNFKQRKRELYQYAKENGFSPVEATLLSCKSKGAIDRLIAQR
ncbi:hypothetical protein LCGC14_1553370 [marine sediment metagenome]|uniref:Uncharacterized protein n=1 Tax=marine sediment metagenome TaxID=412755 RepID=A0A0F9JAQ3_9ZZZZ